MRRRIILIVILILVLVSAARLVRMRKGQGNPGGNDSGKNRTG